MTDLKKDCERKARLILIEGHGCKKNSEDCHHAHCGSWGKCEILQGLIAEALLSEHLIVQKQVRQAIDDVLQDYTYKSEQVVRILNKLDGDEKQVPEARLKYISGLQCRIEELASSLAESHDLNASQAKKIDELAKESVCLREALDSNKHCIADGDMLPERREYEIKLAENALLSISLPIKRLEAQLEAGKEAAGALTYLRDKFVSHSGENWVSVIGADKALQKCREAGMI